jgi:hypothetical protein
MTSREGLPSEYLALTTLTRIVQLRPDQEGLLRSALQGRWSAHIAARHPRILRENLAGVQSAA